VLTPDSERPVVIARLTGLDDVDVIGAEDVPDISDDPATPQTPVWVGRPERNSRCWPCGWSDWFEVRRVHLLRGAGWTYAWGSRTAIAYSTGRPSPTAHPEAELWLGAHPDDPTRLVTAEGEQPLLDILRDDPDGQPGATARGASTTHCPS
jgi:hypothetical protein